MYTEASNRDANDYAEIVTPKLRPGSYCVKFAYHMRGSSMGILEVFSMESSSKTKLLHWRESGDHGDQWKLASFDFISPRNNKAIQFMFESVIGTGYSSDMAIDDINIQAGHCSGIPTKYPAIVSETTAVGITTKITATPTTSLSTSPYPEGTPITSLYPEGRYLQILTPRYSKIT